jgi:NADPH:quinone reductase-like Zn-dependent oxidoreductase
MAGQPYLMRILGFGFRGPKNPVPGLDVAGTVVAVGSGVTRFTAGDEVFGIAVARSPSTPPRGRTSWSASRPG